MNQRPFKSRPYPSKSRSDRQADAESESRSESKPKSGSQFAARFGSKPVSKPGSKPGPRPFHKPGPHSAAKGFAKTGPKAEEQEEILPGSDLETFAAFLRRLVFPAPSLAPEALEKAKSKPGLKSAPVRSGMTIAEPLAELSYAEELKFKNEALRAFWKAKGLPDKPNLIVPSPRPRGYRTTSKRRLIWSHGQAELDFKPEGRTEGATPLGAISALEPEEHARLYAFLLAKLRSDPYASLARAMRFIVIRGDYTRFAVILNVFRINAEVVRKAKMLAALLEREKELNAVAIWLFHGANDSPFYLDQSAPKGAWKAKRLAGPESFPITVGEHRYHFHPLGFSQVNLSLLPNLVADTVAALKLRPDDRFIDLYCGYGLFSLAAASQAGEVLGMDAAEMAIPAARSTAAVRKLSHVRFLRETIDSRSLMRWMPSPGNKPEVLLLDPPKSGAGAGVIRTMAGRSPRRVIQLFCGMDAMMADCDAWRRAGYMLAKAVPYDMFPGTDELEVMAVFVPDKFGLLNRVPVPVEKSLIPTPGNTPRKRRRPASVKNQPQAKERKDRSSR